MVFLDTCKTKLVTTAEFDASALGNYIIKCIVPIASTATVAARSINGDDHAVGGAYAGGGMVRMPGEMIYGSFTKVNVSVGTCYVYYTERSQNL